MRKIIVIILTTISLNSCGQSNTNAEKLIRNFTKDLFDTNIASEIVAERYLSPIKKDKTNNLSNEQRKKNQISHINETRKSPNTVEDGAWLIPNKRVSNPSNIIGKYDDYKDLNKVVFPDDISQIIDGKMYVILDKNRKEILQYFLIKDNKIVSFTLFVKSGDAAFFMY